MLYLGGVLLPSGECSKQGRVHIVLNLGEGKALALDEMLQQIVSLDVQVVDSLVHSLDSGFRGANQVLIGNDFVD